jgi:hypothetical protein
MIKYHIFISHMCSEMAFEKTRVPENSAIIGENTEWSVPNLEAVVMLLRPLSK